MKCHKHNDRDAVSQCLDCGKALCPECSEKYNKPYCNNCIMEHVSSKKMKLIKNSVLMVVFFIIGLSVEGDIIFGLAMAGVPWGWSMLSRITPNIFLFMPIIGWICYFLFKLIISAMIGMFVTPYQIFKIVKGIKEAKELKEYAQSN